MIEFLRGLFEYNHTMNKRVIAILASAPPDPDAIKLMSHIINAHSIWNGRISGLPARVTVWQLHAVADISRFDDENFAKTAELLPQTDLERTVQYVNTRGESYVNKAGDILFHVINHSTHHRAQVSTRLRQLGVAPPVTDYIAYRR